MTAGLKTAKQPNLPTDFLGLKGQSLALIYSLEPQSGRTKTNKNNKNKGKPFCLRTFWTYRTVLRVRRLYLRNGQCSLLLMWKSRGKVVVARILNAQRVRTIYKPRQCLYKRRRGLYKRRRGLYKRRQCLKIWDPATHPQPLPFDYSLYTSWIYV